jgi:hypothetical protein
MEIEQRKIIKDKLEDNLNLKRKDLENKIIYFETRHSELIENSSNNEINNTRRMWLRTRLRVRLRTVQIYV